jgi:hypothetical protein
MSSQSLFLNLAQSRTVAEMQKIKKKEKPSKKKVQGTDNIK